MCADVGIGWEQLAVWAGGGTGKVGNTHYDGTGNSRDGNKVPSRDGKRWAQRPSSGRGREVVVGNKVHSLGIPVPGPARPDHIYFPDPTFTTARTLSLLLKTKPRLLQVCHDPSVSQQWRPATLEDAPERLKII